MYEKGWWDYIPDSYDELEATSWPTKVVKPKVPNGVLLYNGKNSYLSKEQYVYKKVGTDSGMIYY